MATQNSKNDEQTEREGLGSVFRLRLWTINTTDRKSAFRDSEMESKEIQIKAVVEIERERERGACRVSQSVREEEREVSRENTKGKGQVSS